MSTRFFNDLSPDVIRPRVSPDPSLQKRLEEKVNALRETLKHRKPVTRQLLKLVRS